MMYIKTPVKENKPVKPNRRGISNGKPSQWKKKSPLSGRSSGSTGNYGQRIKNGNGSKRKATLPAFTPWKVILASLLIGVCGVFYIGHVFSTQQALQEVRQLENEYNRTKRMYDQKRLQYDRMIGPKEIYRQAQQQGFINAGPADRVITIKP
jgi:hypothetical protein